LCSCKYFFLLNRSPHFSHLNGFSNSKRKRALLSCISIGLLLSISVNENPLSYLVLCIIVRETLIRRFSKIYISMNNCETKILTGLHLTVSHQSNNHPRSTRFRVCSSTSLRIRFRVKNTVMCLVVLKLESEHTILADLNIIMYGF
jgi:hypothetical protein